MTTTKSATAADHLRELRDSGWTMLELADKTGIHKDSLHRYMRDGATPNETRAAAIKAVRRKPVPITRIKS